MLHAHHGSPTYTGEERNEAMSKPACYSLLCFATRSNGPRHGAHFPYSTVSFDLGHIAEWTCLRHLPSCLYCIPPVFTNAILLQYCFCSCQSALTPLLPPPSLSVCVYRSHEGGSRSCCYWSPRSTRRGRVYRGVWSVFTPTCLLCHAEKSLAYVPCVREDVAWLRLYGV